MVQQRKEEFRVDGEELPKKVKQLIGQGNVRRIIKKTRMVKQLSRFL